MLQNRRFDGWTAAFLWTTVLTSVTGFGFLADHISPAHIVGALSLVVLAIAIFARYGGRVAYDVRRDGDGRLLPRRLRAGGAVVPEGAGAESACANTVRTTVCRRTARGARGLRGADCDGVDPVQAG
jgi:hypothetical protein